MNTESIVALITGMGGLLASLGVLLKTRNEAKKASSDTMVNAIEVIRETYSEMLEKQINSVVKPMQDRIKSLEERLEKLNKQVDILKEYQGLFEISIRYIRELCHWLETLPNINTGEKPSLPDELREYFRKEDK